MKPRRYQLRKEAVAIVERGHPWIFRDQMSSAAAVLADGQWLRLVDGANRVVGYGIYESEGAIAIRVLRTGEAAPDAAWLRATLRAALARRTELAASTDGIRLVHGESDRIPAVVVDRFGDTIVVASYAAGSDALARYIARALPAEPSPIVGPATHVLSRPARRRRGPLPPARALRGSPGEVAWFTEDGIRYAVDLAEGHKTGTYLDLRGLRRALATAPLAGARVLNLFAYTGMLGRAAEAAGAASIVHVDQSRRALDFAAAHHAVDRARHQYVIADVFRWLPALDAANPFDLVIVDPPAMTSRKSQVPNVLAAYRKLYRAAERLVRPGGVLVSACCTSRVERDVFRSTVRGVLPPRFTLERDLPPEPDHPVGFPQADYLKVLWWRAAS
jgi:23S rRNA (cytosine1962-C5)-methyltransferase